MTEPDFLKALEDAVAKLERLRRERQLLDLEISKLDQLVSSLRVVTGKESLDITTTGLTDAVRAVLKRETRQGRSPMEIREGMLAMGFDTSKYSQPMAAIHVVIKRLERSGEVIEVGDQPKRYWWTLNGPPPRVDTRRNPPPDRRTGGGPEPGKTRRR